MKKSLSIFTLLITGSSFFFQARAQLASKVADIFPKGTSVDANIAYAGDTLKKHQLDIYFPRVKKLSYPLVVWIHGGAWMSNDKYADMGYMVNTIRDMINAGYAIASIDYRWSTTAPFPAQVQDCNAAIDYLAKNAAQYNIDDSRIALMGFSAGGHLASLIGLSNNSSKHDFYYKGKRPDFKISLVIDFYGPSDLTTIKGHDDPDPKNPVTLLLGGTVAEKPKLAKEASPITWLDRKDPPFLIIQGEKDESVNPDQSKTLSEWLTKAGVPNDLIIVPGAPHYGVMFDAENIRKEILVYLNKYLQ
ncbi:MAG TPA: alpha/beta hydrolase [Mucilaginibacter sp.]|jgi:acetyl esterase/lipase|nr:alpha/beta hydrolase [Mucilaginibacter sp.]